MAEMSSQAGKANTARLAVGITVGLCLAFLAMVGATLYTLYAFGMPNEPSLQMYEHTLQTIIQTVYSLSVVGLVASIILLIRSKPWSLTDRLFNGGAD